MYKQGTIVLTPFPFTDLSGNKVRPAVILSNNKKGSDVVVVFITSKSKRKQTYSVQLKPSDENGLKVPSEVVYAKLATLEKKVVIGELGAVTEKELQMIKSGLMVIFK